MLWSGKHPAVVCPVGRLQLWSPSVSGLEGEGWTGASEPGAWAGNSGGGRRRDRQAGFKLADHWEKVTLAMWEEAQSRASQRTRGPASFPRVLLSPALAHLTNTKPNVQVNSNFR